MKKIYVVCYQMETFDYTDRGEICCFDRKELADEMVARLTEEKPTYKFGTDEYDYRYFYRTIDCGESISDFGEVFDEDYFF